MLNRPVGSNSVPLPRKAARSIASAMAVVASFRISWSAPYALERIRSLLINTLHISFLLDMRTLPNLALDALALRSSPT